MQHFPKDEIAVLYYIKMLINDLHSDHHLIFTRRLEICGKIYKAIKDAKHLIPVAGWLFNPKMALKAKEGVSVRIMLWDDGTSLPFIKNKGVMRTNDEDASACFKSQVNHSQGAFHCVCYNTNVARGPYESESIQDILHWIRETTKMMYRLIGEAIKENGKPWHLRDYLNFFCLSDREQEVEGEFVPPYAPHQAAQYWSAKKH
ncbi:unnamed protein product [Fraxinus pennsylvanica]|uniref:Uncharacterized protein n=1 Tax=Fraxinus pennsylvanica TaxID=56036 RepID=A0AAD1YUQ2_9LAMI|nr:unnamed protein product [Fraxinus pennsylvanica]